MFYWSDSVSLLCAKVEGSSESGYLSERERKRKLKCAHGDGGLGFTCRSCSAAASDLQYFFSSRYYK